MSAVPELLGQVNPVLSKYKAHYLADFILYDAIVTEDTVETRLPPSKVRTLLLHGMSFSAANLERFKNVRHIRFTSWDQAAVDSAGLPFLKNFTRLRRLSASGLGVRSLPDDIFRLKKLKELVIYDNKLYALDAGICKLKKLEVLILGRLSHDSKRASNFIDFLPDCLCSSPRLRYIYLVANRFHGIPEIYVRARRLQLLDIQQNAIPAGEYTFYVKTRRMHKRLIITDAPINVQLLLLKKNR